MSEYTDLARLVTFRPLERGVRCEYRASPFSASWSSTVGALKATHPDHGGDARDFADVQAAREAAIA